MLIGGAYTVILNDLSIVYNKSTFWLMIAIFSYRIEILLTIPEMLMSVT